MTISRSTKVYTEKSYPDLEVTTSPVLETVEIKYEIIKVTLQDNQVVAEFSQTINGESVVEPFRFMFPYSGSGNPLEQSEGALSDYFFKKDKEESQAEEKLNTSSETE